MHRAFYCDIKSKSAVLANKVRSYRYNKSAQGNLERGPRRGAVGHVRRKLHIDYNGAPQIRPQKYPFPWTDPQTPLTASCLEPWTRPTQDAKRHPDPIRRFFHNALDRQTDRQIVHGKFDDYRPLRL